MPFLARQPERRANRVLVVVHEAAIRKHAAIAEHQARMVGVFAGRAQPPAANVALIQPHAALLREIRARANALFRLIEETIRLING